MGTTTPSPRRASKKAVSFEIQIATRTRGHNGPGCVHFRFGVRRCTMPRLVYAAPATEPHMTQLTLGVLIVLVPLVLVGCASTPTAKPAPTPSPRLGNFSVSLSVKDLAASRAFYEKLGFQVVGGDQAQNWLILQNDTATIGLFQGMFPSNMLTFNPGWDRSAASLPDFDDVREIQRTLNGRGLTITTPADESTTGPASLVLVDPDGNPILIDQHIPAPNK